MSKLFSNMTTNGMEETKDVVGGGGFRVLPSGVYDVTIKAAYVSKSQGGAQAINLILDVEGTELTETVYITNRNGDNFYLNKQDQTKRIPLPGFVLIDELCLLATEEPLSAQDVSDKTWDIWDREAKRKLPKSVPTLVDLTGKKVKLAIQKVIDWKTQQNPTTGGYDPIDEIREYNELEKAFHHEYSCTVNEARQNGMVPGVFVEEWKAAHTGTDPKTGKERIRDRTRGVTPGVAGTGNGRPVAAAARPAAGGAAVAAARPGLFGKS